MSASVELDTVAAGVSMVEDGFLFSGIWYGKASFRDLCTRGPHLAKALEEIQKGHILSFSDGTMVEMVPHHVTNISDAVVLEDPSLPGVLKVGRCACCGVLEFVGFHHAVQC